MKKQMELIKEIDITLVLGILILVIGTFIGTYLINLSNRRSNTKRINALEENFFAQTKKLSMQSKEIETISGNILEISKDIAGIAGESSVTLKQNQTISDEVLSISHGLKVTIDQLSSVSSSIQNLNRVNNNILNLIREENKEKGELKLKVKHAKSYSFVIGGNLFQVSRVELVKGYTVILPIFQLRIPLVLRIEGTNLFVSSTIKNINNEITIEIIENKWSLNRNHGFSVNYDESGIEILNEHGLVSFQLNVKNNILSIAMIHYTEDHVYIVPGGKGGVNIDSRPEDGILTEEMKNKASLTKRIFVHHGDFYIGKRLENPM
ncbi:hypothetical protein J0X14_03925 [Muricauda sp. CAU 1633]|uniref:hypothetical protein n=1 Tax=Allomuricauda sp. CAU 1633 TaxID=2816036 RepID=UPI001A8C0E4F|nr:hypothetical protein [Muricauda sp. CAU 1633]MBO0321435.1 hypothetical protein [Muricauda sp. CAU 1633]